MADQEDRKLIEQLMAGGLTRKEALKAVRRLAADGPDVMIFDPKTGKTTPVPNGPSILDV